MDKLFRKIVTPNYYKSCNGKFDKNEFNQLLVYREEINKHLINLEKQEIGVFQVIEEEPKKKKKRVYTKEEVKQFGATYYETHKEKLLKQAKERHQRNKELKAKEKEKAKEEEIHIQEIAKEEKLHIQEIKKSLTIISEQLTILCKFMESI
jgi:hypothetical protein